MRTCNDGDDAGKSAGRQREDEKLRVSREIEGREGKRKREMAREKSTRWFPRDDGSRIEGLALEEML